MAPAGSEDPRNRSTSTWDCRASANISTVAMAARSTEERRESGEEAGAEGSADAADSTDAVGSAAVVRSAAPPARSRRHSEGSCTAAMRRPPTATPAAAERTPQAAPKRNIDAMMTAL